MQEMILEQAKYQDIRHLIQAGDDIMFSGTGPISMMVKLCTNNPVSHIGSIFQTFDDLNGTKRVRVIESTQLNGFVGVTTQYFSEILETYDGDIWWCPLSEERGVRKIFEENEDAFFKFMFQQQGKAYDYEQAVGSALDISGRGKENKEDFSKLFCSELRTAGLKQIFKGLSDLKLKRWDFWNINASEMTPADCCAQRIHATTYYQLKGEPRIIPNFNEGLNKH